MYRWFLFKVKGLYDDFLVFWVEFVLIWLEIDFVELLEIIILN